MSSTRRRRRRSGVALVTGFEPFAGHSLNPSAELARRLDGAVVGGVDVVGRILPVDFARLDDAIATILSELDPLVIVNLGLAAGEPVIRLERVALNLAAFEIPDNAGRLVEAEALDPRAGPALWSRLDLPRIRQALLSHGIPARLSDTAGTYLCNAAMYRFLRATSPRVPCGFVHLPYLRAQVAEMLARGGEHELGRLASMEFPTLRRAVEIVLETSLARTRRKARSTP